MEQDGMNPITLKTNGPKTGGLDAESCAVVYES